MNVHAPRALRVLAISLAILATGCPSKPSGDGTRPEGTAGGKKPGVSLGDKVLVGHFASMSGSEATFGQSTDNGIRLALEERNGKGGVKGKQVEVKTYDDQGKSQEAGTAVIRLITDDKVVAVLGEVASSLSLVGGAVALEYGVPMVSPSSTNPKVTEIGDMIFRVCFIDPYQGYVVAKFTRENLKLSKVAILYDQQAAYSKGLAENFRQAINDMGGSVTTEQTYTSGDQDFSAQLTTIRGTGAEAIFVPGYYTDVGNIALQARGLGIKVPLLGGDGWDSAKLGEIAGAALEGDYYSNHYSPEEQRPEVQQFVDKYKAKFNGQVPDGLAALGYDAANILFDAMESAPSLAGKDIAAALAGTKDFHGVTGLITIDEQRNARKSAVMVQMRGGTPRFVASVPPQ